MNFFWNTRKLTLAELFSENPELDTPESSLVKNKYNSCLPQSWNIALDSAIKFLQEQSFYEENFKVQSNISEHEWQDILIVKKNKDTIIKDTDKGGAIAIMSTKHYLKMISDHLNGKTT